MQALILQGIPLLGICLGHQILALAFSVILVLGTIYSIRLYLEI